ncbi:hypothetical protein [Francisella frigiditurris]|uniref:Prepilin-type N-terminal cleavage/methylation domain protein n=1 Tax=Francisella frigiditurris TaxID=1542390 RepID=A0A1J0KV58_9GAMM|nr:hypothetical protein [Francisella frigiditurris]APC97567.1 hypothetical protein KX01_763 [Francisella frigiditurris]
MKLSVINKNRGMALIEALIASLILLFAFSAAIMIVGSILASMSIENKRDQIAGELDKRVNEYRLSGIFDLNKDGEVIFIQKDVTDQEIKKAEQLKDIKVTNKQNYRIVRFYALDEASGIKESITVVEQPKNNNKNEIKS